ncbi:23S rRNA (cytidine(2498)-2'-O)-methyltransferase RlmM [Salinibius halmophilus]|uniref:23S rRNA (cytidine(2498)-2'-O)-methyltransferase RlmM n=1 Tax=Salinibius halmophilus TaxID=1853216 RepID=UPI000E673581|nr:23S rRNA (cytidine(2498)-2'-O)-methyltransferase RlmM [Salinibius halmophilus]
MQGLIFHVRPGFEADLAAEVASKLPKYGLVGYPKTGAGQVFWYGFQPFHVDQNAIANLVFARQALWILADVPELPREDRVSAVLAALPGKGKQQYGGVRIEASDADALRPLSTLCKKLTNPMRNALRKAGWLSDKEDTSLPWLHLVFTSETSAVVAMSPQLPEWPMGIVRLKFPNKAPSRSTLKLDEAFRVLAPDITQTMGGQWCVDLGAAPGGWTYQLVRRGARVYAVDNGPMDPELMETGQVEHVKADGFSWQPPKQIEWLVCDMVEQPSRVADLMAFWIDNQLCRRAMFNLKLPMKKRWQAVEDALARINNGISPGLLVRAKQLYHDREEITVVIAPR